MLSIEYNATTLAAVGPKLNEDKLQKLAESIATRKLPDGTWEMDHTNAPAFYSFIQGYVVKSAKKSDRFDPDDACQNIYEDIWRALKRYGPRYQNKPFMNLFRTKVNNVLTNRFNKRDSFKSKLNFISESLEGMSVKDPEGNVYEVYSPSTDPIDLICIQESLTPSQKQKLEKFVEGDATMPQMLTVDEIICFALKLRNEDKHRLCIKLWSLISCVSEKTLDKIINPQFEKTEVDDTKYNNQVSESVDANEEIEETAPMEEKRKC